jgi:hypothetical protein
MLNEYSRIQLKNSERIERQAQRPGFHWPVPPRAMPRRMHCSFVTPGTCSERSSKMMVQQPSGPAMFAAVLARLGAVAATFAAAFFAARFLAGARFLLAFTFAAAFLALAVVLAFFAFAAVFAFAFFACAFFACTMFAPQMFVSLRAHRS